MRAKRHLMWMLAFALMALGCKEKQPPLMTVPKEMLEYCWFPNGGYWIYQEESTPGWTDSVYYYTTPSIDTVPDVYGEGYASQDYHLGFIFRGHQWGQVISAEAWGSDPDRPVTFLEENYEDTTDGIEDIVFFWDIHNPDTLLGYPQLVIRQRLDSITVLGKTYFDALDIVANPPQACHHTCEIVWVRHVGIVRRVMRDGTIWALVRYHING